MAWTPAGGTRCSTLIDRVAHQMGLDVILSSHLLDDIERVADAVVIINGGRVLVQGQLRELLAATPMITVRTAGSAASLALWLQARGYRTEPEGDDLHVEYQSDALYDAIRDGAAETGTPLTYLKRRTRSLEDIYLAGQETTPTPVGIAAAVAG